MFSMKSVVFKVNNQYYSKNVYKGYMVSICFALFLDDFHKDNLKDDVSLAADKNLAFANDAQANFGQFRLA